MNTYPSLTGSFRRILPILCVALAFSTGCTEARAEKLKFTINRVLPLVDTDSGAGGDYSDIYVRLVVTPEGGTPIVTESPVITDVAPQQHVLVGYAFPVFSIPPRPVTIKWEIRDKDGSASFIMDQGSVVLPNNDEPWSGGSVGFADAFGEFKAQWVPDWAKLFGIVCDGENGCLDLAGVAEKIETMLENDPKVVKFGFRLSLGLVHYEHAEGIKRSTLDLPAMPNFAVTDRFNPASVTKTFTAVAILRAMEQEGVSIHQTIGTYLPSYWTKGSGINGITFQQLLAHTSGIRGSVSSFADLRSVVAAGVNVQDKIYAYANANYNLCRVLLAYIKGYQEVTPTSDVFGVSGVFTNFINTELLAPLGIPNAAWEPNLAVGTLFYSHTAGSVNQLSGTGFANRTLREGSGGIQLSLREISQLFTRMWTPGQFLSKPTLDKMKEFGMGGRMLSDPLDGPCFAKGGFYPLSGYGAEESSCVVRFGNGLTAVVMINGGVNAFDTLISAYNSSWYEPAVAASKHQVASRLAASAMQQAQLLPAAQLESAMQSYNPVPGSLLYFDPLGTLQLVPDRTQTNLQLTWNGTADPRVTDTIYHSTDLRHWTALERFTGRAGGGLNELLSPISRGGGFFRVGRSRAPDMDSLLDVLNRAPAAIPYPGTETSLGPELLASGLTLEGFAAGPSTSRTTWPPFDDRPHIRFEIDED
jgi:CubicO group peptidase (beta-lactamase class C family)